MMTRAVAILAICVALAGCDQNMTSQPKYAEYEPAPLFRNGQVLQAPVAGTVARDDLARAEDAATKAAADAATAGARPRAVRYFLCAVSQPARRRQRHDRCSAACRDRRASTTSGCARQTDQHFFDVITNGYGVDVFATPTRVPPRDRWAIVAYIRALQLSQHAALDDVPAEDRARLSEAKP